MENITLTVSGMSCQGCADSLGRLFNQEPGILKTSVSFEKGAAELEIDPTLVNSKRISEIVEKAGFTSL